MANTLDLNSLVGHLVNDQIANLGLATNGQHKRLNSEMDQNESDFEDEPPAKTHLPVNTNFVINGDRYAKANPSF